MAGSGGRPRHPQRRLATTRHASRIALRAAAASTVRRYLASRIAALSLSTDVHDLPCGGHGTVARTRLDAFTTMAPGSREASSSEEVVCSASSWGMCPSRCGK
jgi:hypothetical protein